MLKRIAIVGVLALAGLVVGYASTWFGGYRYEIGSTLYLPAHNSPHSAADLVAMTRGHHPGARVWAGRRAITIYATGSFEGAEHAMRVAYGEIEASNDRKFKSYYPDFADQVGFAWGSPVHRGFLGLLAAISVALGLLVPPRSPVARCPNCSRVLRPRRPNLRAANPITLAIVSGIAVVSVTLALAADFYMEHHIRSSAAVPRHLPAGPLRPRLRACMLFYQWEGTRDTNLLNRAVADAHSTRVPQQSKLRFNTDFSGLRNSIREQTRGHSPTTSKYERALQDDCTPIMAAYHVRRP